MNTEILNRGSSFSYRCNACGRCCFNKRIQTNPYEVLRLARNLGISTGEFTLHYLEKEGPYLGIVETGACVFLSEKGCDVHADRPLACRTYPIGRWVSGGGEETFRELKPHPQTEGVYGRDTTVEHFLKQQGVQSYVEAADRYLALFDRLFDALQLVLPSDPALTHDAQTAMFTRDESDIPAFMEWLDVDRAVERYCTEHGLAVPYENREIINLHILAIDQELDKLTGNQP